MRGSLLVLVLVLSTGIAIAAKLSTPASTKVPATSKTPSSNTNKTSSKNQAPLSNRAFLPNQNPLARSAPRNATAKVITLRLSESIAQEQKCQCTLYYMCQRDDVIALPDAENQDGCEDQNVCCRIPTELSSPVQPETPIPTSEAPVVTPEAPAPSSEQSVTERSIPQPVSASNEPLECVCVPFWQCIDYQLLPDEDNTDALINPRITRCEPPDFCCSEKNVNRNASVVTDINNPPLVQKMPDIPQVQPNQPSATASPPEECGIRKAGDDFDLKITGEDSETLFGEFPWMVAVLRINASSTNGTLICGASLLSPFIVLTAAHCVNKIDMSELRVRAGEYNIGNDHEETLTHQDRTISAIHIHSNFSVRKLYNDVALLSVNEPFHYEPHIAPVCAPFVNTEYSAKEAFNPRTCLATGWGKTNFGDRVFSHKLKKVDLTIVNHNDCQNKLRTTRLGAGFRLDSTFICALGLGDTCQGDGGGPLVCATKSNPNKYIQVGIVSWGIGCGKDIPGVYASLLANAEWLTAEVNTMTVFRPF